MGLFQKSVVKGYLDRLDMHRVSSAFDEYKSYFNNPITQQNIRKAKEEQYQEGFLRELFVKIMGYTINPDPGFNLTTEQKNISDSKKADGAIIINDKVTGVIELKGTNTIDLGKIQQQAFYYLSAHPEAVYVVTSNFEKLRFYIQKSNEYEEFNLFALTLDEFKVLYLCLSYDSISNGLPLKIKQESVIKEENITKQLYKDYSNFKNDLFHSLCDRNPNLDKLTLFKASQKLIDRFLFIFFCEDNNGLLPANSISEIIKHWNKLREMDEYKPLYDIFKKYFEYINSGRTAAGDKQEIFAFNGGLFSTDTLLDQLLIEDNILYTHTQKLSTYDFISEVDVNILGHIFEHSLNEIEEIQAELEGNPVDKSKTKRKKDGVFYTPRYITEYIVENTVGKLCIDKKAELGIDEDKFVTAKTANERKPLQDQLLSYKQYLLSLTICDPACGSGAFLNQAYVYLQKEHQYIADLESKLFDAPMGMVDVSADILENNLFGVDINEESVEIVRLALWLRSAKKGRKLNNLSNNIKCGNSLIDDPAVAGDKAFKWEEEFPQVFAKGGFDVVIGNPPYVRAELLGEYKSQFIAKYAVFNTGSDLFAYFYELGINLIKSNVGRLGFISNTFDKTTAGKELRMFLKEKITINYYVDFTDVQIFDGATTYPVIIILDNAKPINSTLKYIKVPKKSNDNNIIEISLLPIINVDQSSLVNENWSFNSINSNLVFAKIKENPTIRDTFGKCYYGVKTGLNVAFITNSLDVTTNHTKPIYEGKDIKKWNTPKPTQKLIFYESKWTKQKYGSNLTEEEYYIKIQQDFPIIFNYLRQYESDSKARYDKGEFWWELRNCAYYDLFEKPKIIFPNLQNSNKFCLDTKGVYINAPAVFLPTDNKTLLCILNSKLVWQFLKTICVVRSGGYIEVKPQYFEQIPIPELKDGDKFNEIADKMIMCSNNIQEKQSKFISRIQNNFQIDNITGKLEKFYSYDFKTFVEELKKQKGVISLKDQDEWEDYFNSYKLEINTLQAEIDKTDKEIDQMVYELYGLTEEEIKVVEGSN